MISKICGHERDVLIWALNQREGTEHFAVFDIPAPTGSKAAFEAICDPAKLAELLAEALRERGFGVLSEDEFAQANEVRVRAFGDQVMVARRLRGAHKIGGPLLELPHARAALLRILELPEGATADDAMKALDNASR